MQQLDLLTTPRARCSDPGTSHEPLTLERLRELFHYDSVTGIFTSVVRRSSVKAGTITGNVAGGNGYGNIGIDCRFYLAHRVAWLYVYGEWPKGTIDHIDGDPLNNRIANLRDVSQRVNNQNRKRARLDNKTGLIGAGFQGGMFRARIGVDGKSISLGRFKTPELAHAAYLAAKRAMHLGNTL